MQYPALITREGKFTLAEFPDCPGCQTFVEEGESIEAAAQEALEGWLESNLGRDLVPPQPTYAWEVTDEVLLVPVDPMLGVRLELRWARDAVDLTQANLARIVGMSQQQVAKLEAGGNPTLSTLTRVAEGLGRRVVVKLEPEVARFSFPPIDAPSSHFLVRKDATPGFAKTLPKDSSFVRRRDEDGRVSKNDRTNAGNVRAGPHEKSSKGGVKGRRGKK